MSVKFDTKQMETFVKTLTYLQRDYENFIKGFMTQMGMRVLARVKLITPVVSGDLRDKWELTSVQVVGSDVHISLINAQEYASFVEDGHMQHARWVPGRWDGDVFRYDPGAKTGMKLTTKWIPGQHMARISINKIEAELPARYQKAFVAFIKKGIA